LWLDIEISRWHTVADVPQALPATMKLFAVSGWFKLATHGHMGKTDIFLNLTGTVLGLALACTLVWRKLYKDFPFFFAYIISSILIAIVRLSVSDNYLTFFHVYWATEAIYALLALLALHEVFRWVFLAFFEKWWFWLFFPSAFVAISTLAALYHFRTLPAQANQVIKLILSLGMAVNWVQAGLFVLFFALVWFHASAGGITPLALSSDLP
jgi:hypothetical protein